MNEAATDVQALGRPVMGSTAAAIGPRPIVGAVTPTQCKVCRSTKRAAVDAALAHGATGRSVAATHGFTKSTVFRHAARCLPVRLARANAEREDRVTSASLLDDLVSLQSITREQIEEAIAQKNKPGDLARLLKVAQDGIALQGRFVGAFAGENASTIVDNRVQIASLQSLSTEDLLSLTTALRSKKAAA